MSVSKRPSAQEALNHPWIKSYKEARCDEGKTKSVLKNLSKYQARTSLKKAALQYITTQLVAKED
jgi:hypothetical protein